MNKCEHFLETASTIKEKIAGKHINSKLEPCISNINKLNKVLDKFDSHKPNIETEFYKNTKSFSASAALKIQNTNYNNIYGTPKERWYEIPLSDSFLNNKKIINIDSESIVKGRLFSTAMPRNVIYAPTNLSEFIERSRLSRLNIVVPLTHHEEFLEYSGTGELKELYEGIGLECYPIEIDDFEVPSENSRTKNIQKSQPNYTKGKVQFRKFYENILYLVGEILKGKNILVHCAGGTGRTGLVLASICKLLGINDPISHIRKYGKSTYVETYRQITYINRLKLPFNEHFFKYITDKKFIFFRLYKHITSDNLEENNSNKMSSKYKKFGKDNWVDLTKNGVSNYTLDEKNFDKLIDFINNIGLKNISKFYNLFLGSKIKSKNNRNNKNKRNKSNKKPISNSLLINKNDIKKKINREVPVKKDLNLEPSGNEYWEKDYFTPQEN